MKNLYKTPAQFLAVFAPVLFLASCIFFLSPHSAHASYVNDTFTEGTDGVNLEDHTSDSGATWAQSSGGYGNQMKIYTNALDGTDDWHLQIYHTSAVSASADYDVQADFYATPGSHTPMLCGRVSTSAQTGYCVGFFNGSAWELYRFTNNSGSQLGYFASSGATNAVYQQVTAKLEMRGTQLNVYIAGATTPQISYDDVGGITAAGRAGAATYGGVPPPYKWMDNWSATDFSAPPAVTPSRVLRLFAGFVIRIQSGQVFIRPG